MGYILFESGTYPAFLAKLRELCMKNTLVLNILFILSAISTEAHAADTIHPKSCTLIYLADSLNDISEIDQAIADSAQMLAEKGYTEVKKVANDDLVQGFGAETNLGRPIVKDQTNYLFLELLNNKRYSSGEHFLGFGSGEYTGRIREVILSRIESKTQKQKIISNECFPAQAKSIKNRACRGSDSFAELLSLLPNCLAR